MNEDSSLLHVQDTAVHLYHWTPDTEPVAVLQIVHGMGEHAARYARFARALTERGWAVVAHDQRGHGQTAHSVRDLGYFADEDGWAKVVGDVRAVSEEARRRHPDAPLAILGHSMGSYALQSLLFEHDDYAAAVISGSTLNTGLLVKVGRQLAKLERWRLGRRKVSWLLQRLSFGAFSRAIPDRRTEFDWLSRDPAEVDKYVEDPLCGFPSTTGLWVDLLEAFRELEKPENVAKIRKDLPIRIMSGGEDPVHEGQVGFRRLVDLYTARGFDELDVELVEGARHELLNETNRDQVTADLIAWLEAQVQTPAAQTA
mgnify:CR=1 FL=1